MRDTLLTTAEKELQVAVQLYLTAALAGTIYVEYFYYKFHHAFAFGDWLINYRSGWIRRGLFGDITLILARALHVSPGFLVWMTWNVIYGLLFLFAYMAWAIQEEKWPFALAIFSPFLFVFSLRLGAFPRKEILSFLLIFALTVTALYCPKKHFQIIAYGAFFVYPVLILSHEALILLLPYLLGIYYWKMGFAGWKPVFASVMLSLGVFIVVIVISVLAPPSQKQVAGIYKAISRAGYPLQFTGKLDPISALGWKWTFVQALWRNTVNHGMVKQCLIAIPLSITAFWPLAPKLKQLLASPVMRNLLLASILGTIIVSLVAIDWGRFLYMHLTAWFAWTLLPVKAHISLKSQHYKIFAWGTLALVPLYALSWHLGFQCQIWPSSIIQQAPFLSAFLLSGIRTLLKYSHLLLTSQTKVV